MLAAKVRSFSCRCICGREVVRPIHNVLGGSTTHCGCRPKMAVPIDLGPLIGKRFGKLVVVAIGPKVEKGWGKTYSTMTCKCDCGGTKDCMAYHLVSGNVRSCGCLRNRRSSAQVGVPTDMRRCLGCKEIKSLDEFSHKRDERGKLKYVASYCSDCNRSYQVWYRINMKYGMTRGEVLSLGDSQGWKCAICGRKLDDRRLGPGAKSNLSPIPHIDHDHSLTGKESVRGILCIHCNRGLGGFNSIEDLKSAIAYLEKYHKRVQHLGG